MNLNTAVTVFSHLIALAGFLSLFVTGEISAAQSSIFCAVLLNSFVKERYGKGLYLGQNTLTLIGLLLTAYVFFNTIILGAPVIKAIILFLIFLFLHGTLHILLFSDNGEPHNLNSDFSYTSLEDAIDF